MYDGTSNDLSSFRLAKTRSGYPSPFRSPVATPAAPSVGSSERLCAEKPFFEPQYMKDGTAVLFPSEALAIAMSANPSLLKSPMQESRASCEANWTIRSALRPSAPPKRTYTPRAAVTTRSWNPSPLTSTTFHSTKLVCPRGTSRGRPVIPLHVPSHRV